MQFAFGYLAFRFFFRIFDAFRDWYGGGSRLFFAWCINFLERLDETFALKITLRYFFVPLYRDYTIVGRIVGVIFRSARIAAGVIVYLFLCVIFCVVYFFWVAIPPYLILALFS